MAIMLTAPAAPFLYYGDEIGMGDNVYLPGADGLRTPMQWTADRNGGFSLADVAQLALPPVADPVYGYQAVNVEAQLRTPSSFLRFVKRLIAAREQEESFASDGFDLLSSGNPAVLAFVREGTESRALCVFNLSRRATPAALVLHDYAGLQPVDLLGHDVFPTIGSPPYVVTMSPHAFFHLPAHERRPCLHLPARERPVVCGAEVVEHRLEHLQRLGGREVVLRRDGRDVGRRRGGSIGGDGSGDGSGGSTAGRGLGSGRGTGGAGSGAGGVGRRGRRDLGRRSRRKSRANKPRRGGSERRARARARARAPAPARRRPAGLRPGSGCGPTTPRPPARPSAVDPQIADGGRGRHCGQRHARPPAC